MPTLGGDVDEGVVGVPRVTDVALEMEHRYIVSNSFGFGGLFSSVVFGKVR